MTEHEKTATVREHGSGGAGNQSLRVSAVTPVDFDFNHLLQRCQVAKILGVGAERGLTRRELCAMLDTDERTLRRMIRQERLAGVLIVSDCQHGYFLPASIADVTRFIRQTRHRARELNKVGEATETGLLRLTGQQTLFDGLEIKG